MHHAMAMKQATLYMYTILYNELKRTVLLHSQFNLCSKMQNRSMTSDHNTHAHTDLKTIDTKIPMQVR